MSPHPPHQHCMSELQVRRVLQSKWTCTSENRSGTPGIICNPYSPPSGCPLNLNLCRGGKEVVEQSLSAITSLRGFCFLVPGSPPISPYFSHPILRREMLPPRFQNVVIICSLLKHMGSSHSWRKPKLPNLLFWDLENELKTKDSAIDAMNRTNLFNRADLSVLSLTSSSGYMYSLIVFWQWVGTRAPRYLWGSSSH